MPKHMLFLIAAIVTEVLGTSLLKVSDGFTKWLPAGGAILCFVTALVLLSQVLNVMPVGVVYAIWSGLGIALITVIGVAAFGQKLDLAGYLGILLIVAGVLVLQLFSKTGA